MHPLYDGMPALHDSLSRFQELGFGISGLFPVSLDSNLEVIEFDCVAVRHDAARTSGRPGAVGSSQTNRGAGGGRLR